jgi:hypothetical protein
MIDLSKRYNSISFVIIVLSFGMIIWIGCGCNFFTNCKNTKYAYIIGEREETRSYVAKSVAFSATRFQVMTGDPPHKGTIILDRNVSLPLIAHFFSKWQLPFYRASSASPGFGSELSGAMKSREAGDHMLTSGVEGASDLMANKAVLSHEICHLLVQAHAEGRKVPMAFQEAISIGCEPRKMRSDRIKLAVRSKFFGLWSDFLTSEHPLDGALGKKYLNDLKNETGVTRLHIPVGTEIEERIFEYYSRAAMMVEFLEHRCGNGHPIGRLLAVTDKDFDIGSWMKESGGVCFGPNEVSFSRKVDNYVLSLRHGGMQ